MDVDVEFQERYWYPDDGGEVWVAGYYPVDSTGRFLARDALPEDLIVSHVAGAVHLWKVPVYGCDTFGLLNHYLDSGLSEVPIPRQHSLRGSFIYHWVRTVQIGRDLSHLSGEITKYCSVTRRS